MRNGSGEAVTKLIRLARLESWIKAARLRTLPLSVSGIIVGTCIAASRGYFDASIFILALVTTIGFQILSNFANDYGDGLKGTDNDDRVGPERAIQSGEISPKQMKKGMTITSVVTVLVALMLIYISFGKDNPVYAFLFVLLGISSIVAAIKYTVGDNAYGYNGLGDLFVFLFFGLLSVCGSYFLYAKSIDYTVFLPAFSVGLLSVSVLNLNNMRDMESDKKANKVTLVVRIGAEFARYYHYYLIGASLLFALMYTSLRFSSPYQFLFLLAYVPLLAHVLRVNRIEDFKLLDPELKKVALSTFLFSILFGIGLLL